MLCSHLWSEPFHAAENWAVRVVDENSVVVGREVGIAV